MESRRRAPRWLTTAVLALSGMMAAIQFTTGILLLPTMSEVLDVTANDASWMVTVTLLSSATATPVLARLADMYGKRRMIVIALSVMTVGSIVIAVGASYPTMIVGRAMQGFAQALIPIGISLLRDLLPRERVGSAVALMSATLGIGAALGLPLSGVLFDAYGWQSVFWFTGVAGALFVVAVLLTVQESPVRTFARFDIAGAVLFSVVLTATLLVISKIGRWDAAVIIALAGVAAVGLAGWIPLQLRMRNPVVDLRTTTRLPVLLTNSSTLFVTAGTFVSMIVGIQQIQAPTATGYGFGMSSTVAGLAMLPSGLVMVAMAPVSGALLNRWGGRPALILGSTIMALSFVFRALVSDTLTAVTAGAVMVSIGSALAFAALPTLIMASVPLTETASANGINSLARSVAMSISSALIALLATTMAISVGGHAFLSAAAVQLCFWLAAAAGVVAATIAALIPTDTRI